MNRGVVYVAYGEQAIVQVRLSIRGMREHNPGLPICVISDAALERIGREAPPEFIYHEDTDIGARWPKLNVDKLTPFENTLYIDADTRIAGNIERPFELLEAGWELCACPTSYQGIEAHGHVNAEERAATFEEVGTHAQVIQAGVMYFRRCSAIHKLFATWRAEWKRWEDQDQAALVRALAKRPVKLRTLSRDYNDANGRLVKHRCGFARRDGLKYSRAV